MTILPLLNFDSRMSIAEGNRNVSNNDGKTFRWCDGQALVLLNACDNECQWESFPTSLLLARCAYTRQHSPLRFHCTYTHTHTYTYTCTHTESDSLTRKPKWQHETAQPTKEPLVGRTEVVVEWNLCECAVDEFNVDDTSLDEIFIEMKMTA